MKNIWTRLAAVYGSIFVGTSLLYCLLLYRYSPELFLNQKFIWLSAIYGLVVMFLLTLASINLTRFLNKPVVSLSKQLDSVDITNINRKLFLPQQGPEIKRLIDQINDLLSQIHVGLNNLNKYSAQVAHELRTPLTIIRLKVEQAVDKIDPQLSEEIQDELLRLTLHLERTLLITRAEQGHLPLNRSDFDLKSVLDQVAEGFSLLASEEKREIRLTSASTVIYADLAYTKQILYNLLSNALRYGQGPIYVRLRSTKQSVYFLVINRLKALPAGTFSLGLGSRIVQALASVHGNMHVRSKKWRNHYSVQFIVGPLSYFSP